MGREEGSQSWDKRANYIIGQKTFFFYYIHVSEHIDYFKVIEEDNRTNYFRGFFSHEGLLSLS